MGRVNGHTVEEVIASVRRNHGMLAAVARDLDITRQTVYRYVKTYATVAQAVDDERQTLLDMAETELFKAVKKGALPAIMFVLKTVGKDRGYVERSQQELTGAGGEPLCIVVQGPKE